MHDLTGQKFGRLTALYVSGRKNNRLLWHCKCECGNEVDLTSNRLLHPQGTKSCGCLRKEVMTKKATKHGMSNTRIYNIWLGIKDRCYNPNEECYQHYGGRGIQICDRWLDFQNFYDDMKKGYARNLSIDRIDVNGNYEPNNCRWATQKQQCNNTRRNVLIEYNGEVDTVMRMCKKYGAGYDSVIKNIRNGRDPTQVMDKYRTK